MKVTFLGTSGMKPTKKRNHPAVHLLYRGEGILFDCGEGTQRQLQIAGIKGTKIKKILITHLHGDHVLGIPGLLQTLSASEYTGKLKIYGPEGIKKFMKIITEAFETKDLLDFEVKEVNKGKACEEEDYEIHSDILQHTTKCVGYSFTEKDKRKIDKEKAEEQNIPEGPHMKKLKEGKNIKYEDKKIKSDEITYIEEGRKISYVLDTRPCNGAINIAKNSDLLITEAVYKSDLKEKGKEYCHLTAKEAAMIANQAGAKKLVLTHFSTRYTSGKPLEEEAREIFDNTQAAEDFMEIQL